MNIMCSVNANNLQVKLFGFMINIDCAYCCLYLLSIFLCYKGYAICINLLKCQT